LRASGKLKNPTQANLQDAYNAGATKAELKKALRAGGLQLKKVEEMLGKIKPLSIRNPQMTMKQTTTKKPKPIAPQTRQIAKMLGISITRNGMRYEYKTADGKTYNSLLKALANARHGLKQAVNPFGFDVRKTIAKRALQSKLRGLQTSRDKAKAIFDKAEKEFIAAQTAAQALNPRRGGLQHNPEVDDVYEMFQGRGVTNQFETVAPAGTPDDLAQLGKLCWLEICTAAGEYLTLDFETPNNQAPLLTADVRGNLHIVGGTYRMPESAGETLGFVNRIAYETAKTHIGDGQTFEYIHEFAEESGGDQPKLKIDKDGLFKLSGGVYQLQSAGIVD
jgi:hypothetical protein